MTLDDVLALAKRLLLEAGEVGPFLLVSGEKATTRFSLQAEDREQAIKQLLVFGYTAARDPNLGPLHQVFLLTEGWMSRPLSGQPVVLPVEDPHRLEVLMIAAYTRETRSVDLITYEIVRTDQAAALELKRLTEVDDPKLQKQSPLLDAFVYGYEQGI